MQAIQVHAFCLNKARNQLAEALRLLTPAESQRAARFRMDAHREEFALSRLLLKRALAGCLGIAAKDVRLAIDRHGKPFLDPGCGSGVCFNISHSHGRLLVAVSDGLPVGIDIERVDPDVDPLSLAKTGLSPEDVEELLGLDGVERRERFYALWTRREALLKAVGTGFLGHAVKLRNKAWMAAGFLFSFGDQGELLRGWDLPVDAGYRAAVAVVVRSGEETPHELHLQMED